MHDPRRRFLACGRPERTRLVRGRARTQRRDGAPRAPPLRLQKRRGGHRLLEAPKTRLKALQRRILQDILRQVPTHNAAHGFVSGRSALTCARVHADRSVVLRIDLEDYFPSIGAARVYRLFRTVGYPEAVAQVLTAAKVARPAQGMRGTVSPALAVSGSRRASSKDTPLILVSTSILSGDALGGKPYAEVVPVGSSTNGKPRLSFLSLAGTGHGLWGHDSRKTLKRLRDEWR